MVVSQPEIIENQNHSSSFVISTDKPLDPNVRKKVTMTHFILSMSTNMLTSWLCGL